MTFRDDHDAALARIQALESELERRDERIESLQRELDAARKPKRRSPDEPPRRRVLVGVFAAIVLVAIVSVVIVASRRGDHPSEVGGEMSASVSGASWTPAMPDEVSALVAEAYAQRDATIPGAPLHSLRGDGIDEQGRLDPVRGVIELEFQRAPSSCMTFRVTAAGWHTDAGLCTNPVAQAIHPRCTTRAIWTMAIAGGAPSGSLAYLSFDGASWYFRVDGKPAFQAQYYGDDCPPAP